MRLLPRTVVARARWPLSPGTFPLERKVMRRLVLTAGLGFALVGAGATLRAHAPSGAIFTTVADGGEVNFNHSPSKDAVYLDGGPGVQG